MAPARLVERARIFVRSPSPHGERVENCSESTDGLAFTHSHYVLSRFGIDGHTLVRVFHTVAAAAPQAGVANPVA